MKKLALGAAMLMATGSAFAANSLQPGQMALSVDAFNSPDLTEVVAGSPGAGMIKGKYMISRDMQVNAGFGIGIWGGDAEGTDLSILAGVRKFIRTDDLAPFIGGRISYSTLDDGDVKGTELAAEFGAEYFVGKQMSVEGSASFGYASGEVDSNDFTRLGTSRAGVAFNFYF